MFPVTQWQYNEIYGSNPSAYQTDSDGNNHWYRPVEQVRWYTGRMPEITTKAVDIEGNTFLGKFNKLTQTAAGVTGFDYPTKIMGEIAARGGADTEYPWGPSTSGYSDYVVAWTNTTVEVGSKLPNGFGLYDMLGNVREWALDDTSRTDKADAPDPWTPAYEGTIANRLVTTVVSFQSTFEYSSRLWALNPAAIYSESYNKQWRENGFRVAFIVK